MFDIAISGKNKINLSDFNYTSDIENRILLSQFSHFDFEVLEEILFSSLTIPIENLEENLQANSSEILPILERLEKGGLCKIEGNLLIIDKEMRKYYEFQIEKFSSNFKPDMEFLQTLLRKVPIHILPIWYSIPRTSNNIFASIVEKFLINPHVYKKYLNDLQDSDPVFVGMMEDVFSSPNLEISASELKKKYSLSDYIFQKYMLYLELNFVCCLVYKKEKNHWKEVVSAFHEWREYLLFLQTQPPLQKIEPSSVLRTREKDFAFIEEMTLLLEKVANSFENKASKEALRSYFLEKESDFPQAEDYFESLLAKLCQTRLLQCDENNYQLLAAAQEWISLSSVDKALFLHRHPANRLLSNNIPEEYSNERIYREIEKSLKPVIHSGWIYFDEFMTRVTVSFDEHNVLKLTRKGKTWSYTLPQYNEAQLDFFHAMIFEWLFHLGIVATGSHDDQICFSVTEFGKIFLAS